MFAHGIGHQGVENLLRLFINIFYIDGVGDIDRWCYCLDVRAGVGIRQAYKEENGGKDSWEREHLAFRDEFQLVSTRRRYFF